MIQSTIFIAVGLLLGVGVALDCKTTLENQLKTALPLGASSSTLGPAANLEELTAIITTASPPRRIPPRGDGPEASPSIRAGRPSALFTFQRREAQR